MTTKQIIEELRQMSNADRLSVIEEATRMVRQAEAGRAVDVRTARRERMRAAAESVKDLYEPGGVLTEWTALDGEEFLDESGKE